VKFTFEPDDLDILQGIVEESTEHLKGIEAGILKLEAEFDPQLVDAVFRALHSIKGVASFVDLVPVKNTAHALESLLDDVRTGTYAINADITDLVLRGADILGLLIAQLANRIQEVQGTPLREPFEVVIEECDFQEFVLEVERMRTRSEGATEGKAPTATVQEAGETWESSPAYSQLELSSLADQMLTDFLEETREHLDTIEQNCVQLEKCPQDRETLNAILRGFHSIKGAAGLISSMREQDDSQDPVLMIKNLTHATETLVETYRNHSHAPTAGVIDLVLQVVDKVAMLLTLVQEKQPADFSPDQLVAQVEKLAGTIAIPASTPACLPSGSNDLVARFNAFLNITGQALESMANILATVREGLPINRKRFKQYIRALRNVESSASYLGFDDIVRASGEQLAYLDKLTAESDTVLAGVPSFLRTGYDRLKQLLGARVSGIQEMIQQVPPEYADKRLGEILIAENKITSRELDRALKQQKRVGEILVDEGAATPADVAIALQRQATAREKAREKAGEGRTPAGEPGSQSVRVSQEKLDRLMNMIGELLIAKNRIFHLAAKIGSQYDLPALAREVKSAAAELAHIADELQDAIMSARMLPLRVLFQRYPRTIRDISRRANKLVELTIAGEDTELDKAVIEAINDPLVHMLRNAVDHGIESPEQRLASGKDASGHVRLAAYYQGNHDVIELTDDGGGLNPEQIKLKALQKGLIKPHDIEKMSNEEAYQLIFTPGFSTRDEISELSGRGVGMDVVKNNVERVGGSIEVNSTPGTGTTFALKIPLSMSIIHGLMVQTAGQAFILPLDAVQETVKLPRANTRSYRDHMVADIRGEVLPLVYLARLLGLEARELAKSPAGSPDDDRLPIVVIDAEGIRVGIIVDRLQGQQEFFVKSLGEELASLKIYAGVTILGDGSVALILNPVQLLKIQLFGKIGG